MELVLSTTPAKQALSATALVDDFEGVVREHQSRVFRTLLGMLRDRDAAETLMQETFLRAYQHREKFRGEASIGTWILRIAINLGRDHIRNQRMRFWRKLFQSGVEVDDVAELVPDSRPTAERDVLGRERIQQVWDAAEKLSPRQRAVFTMRYVEDMSMDDIAKATGLTPGTVKQHLFRAVAAVQKAVRAEEGKK
jgi:RNA polymerase sigma-70 factor (ECF subfamily)